MTPVELSRTVLRAVRCAVDEGELSVAVPVRAVVTPPGPGGCGDYATNIALQLARPAGRPPRQVAEILRPHLSRTAGVAGVEITGPGFLNIHLEAATATIALVREILDGHANGHANGHAIGHAIDSGHDSHGTPYGHTPTLTGQVIPLRIPYDIRAEVVADSLVRIVASQGGRAEVDHVRAGEAVTLRPVPAPEDPAPSVPTPPAGRCCTPPPTTGPASPPTTSRSARATPSSGSGTPTRVPVRSPVAPPGWGSTANPVTYPLTYPAQRFSSGSSPGTRTP
ncbi:hypothetical protein SAVCW2_52080 [Streptomyces avermitilis]|nr:hypothetical protein SAVCW2_52080 [Streptomyces avermitilis]